MSQTRGDNLDTAIDNLKSYAVADSTKALYLLLKFEQLLDYRSGIKFFSQTSLFPITQRPPQWGTTPKRLPHVLFFLAVLL
jgi:hypothetical protein